MTATHNTSSQRLGSERRGEKKKRVRCSMFRWHQLGDLSSSSRLLVKPYRWRQVHDVSPKLYVFDVQPVTPRESTDYTRSSTVYVQSNALTTKLSVQRRFPHTYPLHCWCLRCAILVHRSDLYNEVFFEGPRHFVIKASDCAVALPITCAGTNLSNHKHLAVGGHVQVTYQCGKRKLMALKNNLLALLYNCNINKDFDACTLLYVVEK